MCILIFDFGDNIYKDDFSSLAVIIHLASIFYSLVGE